MNFTVCERREIQIEVNTETVNVLTTLIPATEAFELQLKLVKVISPYIKCLESIDFNTKGASFDSANFSFDKLAEALINLNLNEYQSIVKNLLRYTIIEDKYSLSEKANFDLIFTGKIGFLYKVLGFVLKVNYEDFFEVLGIGKILVKIKELMPKNQPKQPEEIIELKP